MQAADPEVVFVQDWIQRYTVRDHSTRRADHLPKRSHEPARRAATSMLLALPPAAPRAFLLCTCLTGDVLAWENFARFFVCYLPGHPSRTCDQEKPDV